MTDRFQISLPGVRPGEGASIYIDSIEVYYCGDRWTYERGYEIFTKFLLKNGKEVSTTYPYEYVKELLGFTYMDVEAQREYDAAGWTTEQKENYKSGGVHGVQLNYGVVPERGPEPENFRPPNA